MKTDSNVLVLLSSYNGEKYIREQIESIMSQEGIVVNLLIRDDGSSDNTLGIIDDMRNKYGDVISYYSGDNVGYGKSFQSLLMTASANYDYYAFADQDDVWNQDKIKIGIDTINNREGAMLYCSRPTYVDENLCPLRNVNRSMLDELPSGYAHYNDVLATGLYGLGCSMVWNNKLQLALTRLNSSINIVSHDNFMTILAGSIGNVYLDKRHTFLYRQHNNNVSGDKRADKKKQNNKKGYEDRYFYIRKILADYFSDTIDDKKKHLFLDSVSYRNQTKAKIRLLLNGMPRRLDLYQKIKFVLLVLSNRF